MNTQQLIDKAKAERQGSKMYFVDYSMRRGTHSVKFSNFRSIDCEVKEYEDGRGRVQFFNGCYRVSRKSAEQILASY